MPQVAAATAERPAWLSRRPRPRAGGPVGAPVRRTRHLAAALCELGVDSVQQLALLAALNEAFGQERAPLTLQTLKGPSIPQPALSALAGAPNGGRAMTVTIKHEAQLVQTRPAPREGAANLGARLAACRRHPAGPRHPHGWEGISEGGSDEQWLSYGALNDRVAQIAARLQGLAVGSGSASISPAASIWWPACWPCLRLGLTFVPLEPDFPVERLQGIARQARLSAVICDGDRPAPPSAVRCAPSTGRQRRGRLLAPGG
jgi:non-ribosomal peptide synthetase component F